MHCVLVTHTHWDREWYRTFQSFRARLVDAVDCLLDLVRDDPGYRFVLDGQTIVLEDYVEIRPDRRAELESAIRAGRVAIGPWYVQPDSLLPQGETHVRNLLEGRRVGRAFGPVSEVAYTPDSFGHPAQFPQLLRGFGLDGFVYWRGNGSEIERLRANWIWVAPDGTRMLACHLSHGYFSAAGLGRDPAAAVEPLRELALRLARFSDGEHVILMNGSDHRPPDPETGAVARALEDKTGWTVERGLMDAYTSRIAREGLPEFTGELIGGRLANLLPGVWSTRSYLKRRNRQCETALLGWAEPWVALGRLCGAPDERPALRSAWRSLLPNQAHDSICGCSQDAVHRQMLSRYDAAEELGRETTERVLERLAGLATERTTAWSDEPDLAVFNPSPHPRSDVVRFALDPWPGMLSGLSEQRGAHPLLIANLREQGYTADGAPVRFVPSTRDGRSWPADQRPFDLEFVVRDVPAFGWRRVRLERCPERAPDETDQGREIESGSTRVAARDDGTLDVSFGDVQFSGLLGLEDLGDRGDSYDFDPVSEGECKLVSVSCTRRRHPSGLCELEVRRTLEVPAELDADGEHRSETRAELTVTSRARLVPGLARVDLFVRVENTARDHRLRLLFPTGAPVETFRAETTFGIATRSTTKPDAERWRHPAPDTTIQQGFVRAGGLTVAAPGLPEAEVTPDGVIAITLLRAVGWLAKDSLRTRPQAAGPPVPTPEAQCAGALEVSLALLPHDDVRAVKDAELGLHAVTAAPDPPLAPDTSLLALEPRELLLSALKPAEDGPGTILRVLNPTDAPLDAELRLGIAVSSAEAVRLDETPADEAPSLAEGVLRFAVPPHALRSVLLRS